MSSPSLWTSAASSPTNNWPPSGKLAGRHDPCNDSDIIMYHKPAHSLLHSPHTTPPPPKKKSLGTTLLALAPSSIDLLLHFSSSSQQQHEKEDKDRTPKTQSRRRPSSSSHHHQQGGQKTPQDHQQARAAMLQYQRFLLGMANAALAFFLFSFQGACARVSVCAMRVCGCFLGGRGVG